MVRRIPYPIVSLVSLLVMVAVPAASSFPEPHLILPAAGTGPGVPPSYWYTTIWVYNPWDIPTEVEFSFLLRDQSNDPADIIYRTQVEANTVLQIDDAVNTMFGMQGFGAIRIVASEPIHVTSRIFSQESGDQERDSSGQAFFAVPEHQSLGVGMEADLIGLTNLEGGDFRYNVGFVETRGQPVTISVELFTTGGSSWVSNSIQLQPFEQRQMSVNVLFNNVIGESDNFRLRVSVLSGDGRVIVLGSRIANGSNDATTFGMLFPGTR
jgi:hypothetical protein